MSAMQYDFLFCLFHGTFLRSMRYIDNRLNEYKPDLELLSTLNGGSEVLVNYAIQNNNSQKFVVI